MKPCFIKNRKQSPKPTTFPPPKIKMKGEKEREGGRNERRERRRGESREGNDGREERKL